MAVLVHVLEGAVITMADCEFEEDGLLLVLLLLLLVLGAEAEAEAVRAREEPSAPSRSAPAPPSEPKTGGAERLESAPEFVSGPCACACARQCDRVGYPASQ